MPRPFALFASVLLIVGATMAAPARAADVPSMVIKDVVVGTGDTARDDSQVRIQYTGWLYDAKAPDHHGAKFDSSYDSGQPLVFTVGAQEVIPGMDSGVKGMKVGGKRTLIIPSNLGYGRHGASPDIPPNTALVFDIELLKVQ
ncbi:FKBP-type peptidyl-prolyl cis-trans isomerase [Dyella monticola]|uniref:Peptidyl-prolyl cis-trans isomerase n=1 Tax=Dyella monticola TaxID=1927958 RepID=A0A370X973_9GAMM|nr:FKBP-type peptidyl-prolyl cis-trans isomerase [Dyella monticola]RDS84969.1 FKBP-type peptidyl-prolyl cis-trans isomerase [Dyella monticola]